ncbi:MAG TPA: hypothetical protein VES42_15335, partial [Pilimelia sp.]|nr:hypothetical protein [Pilimelia sp.]
RGIGGPALPAIATDPGTPGPYRTVTGEYALRPVRLPDFREPVELAGVVVAPTGAAGRRPLVLFLHGRHSTCYHPGGDEGEDGEDGAWPCPAGWRPIPSHRGYLAAQRLLASQGYVTVSISANGINGQDIDAADHGMQARSSLVRLHLARWAQWAGQGRRSAPAVVRAAPPADPSQVLLVGHSRGGEGVNRAAIDSVSPPPAAVDGFRGRPAWRIKGMVLIAPTIFGQNPAADVPSTVLLPGCDGDVADLQGQLAVDQTRGVSRGRALHSAVYVVGANHNYFNTEWTPGQAQAPAWDDWWDEDETKPDPLCSTTAGAARLTPAQQQAVGSTYIAAAARLFVRGDDRVRPLLDGTGVRAPSAGRARVLAHAVGGGRTPLVVPDEGVRVSGPAGSRRCAAVAPGSRDTCIDVDFIFGSPSPHFAWFDYIVPEPDRHAVALAWSRPGTPVRVRPAAPAALAGATAVALRLAVPPNSTGTRFDVAVADTAGRRAVLGQVRLDGLPGTGRTASHWAQEVRVPLTAARQAGIDLRRVARVDLVPRGPAGHAWLIDAWGWRPGTPASTATAQPRLDIGQLTVIEGDSGVRTYRVPTRVSGPGSGTFRLFVTTAIRATDPTGPVGAEVASRLITVRPGTRHVDVPIRVAGNTRYGYGQEHRVAAKAVRGTVVGNWAGGVRVTDDDPAPQVRVTAVADQVREGASLRWRMTLSETADVDVWVVLPILAPTAGAGLSTTDVDPQWLAENLGLEPRPERPLAAADFPLLAVIPSGGLEA